MRRDGEFSFEKRATRDRAVAMHDFMTACASRGIKVTIRLKELYDPDKQAHESHLFLSARTVTEGRDPLSLEARIDGDIRDTIRLVALQIGLRPRIA